VKIYSCDFILLGKHVPTPILLNQFVDLINDLIRKHSKDNTLANLTRTFLKIYKKVLHLSNFDAYIITLNFGLECGLNLIINVALAWI
jgi:hypothetical protein